MDILIVLDSLKSDLGQPVKIVFIDTKLLEKSMKSAYSQKPYLFCINLEYFASFAVHDFFTAKSAKDAKIVRIVWDSTIISPRINA